ncbi:MAG TPA: hypothetical protein VK009_07150 [Chloroflexota bacterium]|nr:hypothetical protein [Chloroflexota bacterium]
MHDLSRRKFLGWTSAGALGAGLLALAPRLAARDGEADRASAGLRTGTVTTPSPAITEPVVAYAHDPASGQLSVMAGTSEVVVHDPELVARLRQLLAR